MGDMPAERLGGMSLSGGALAGGNQSGPQVVHAGKLERQRSGLRVSNEKKVVWAQLTEEELQWGQKKLRLQDMVAVDYHRGSQHFTIHGLPAKSWSRRRTALNVSFWAPDEKAAEEWAHAIAVKSGCWKNGLLERSSSAAAKPRRYSSSETSSTSALLGVGAAPLFSKSVSDIGAGGTSVLREDSGIMDVEDATAEADKLRSPQEERKKFLVIVNPMSGHGLGAKVLQLHVLPVFDHAGVRYSVVKTEGPGHATKLAAHADLQEYSDGIVCVGGDGLVNEVMNGLYLHSNRAGALAVPLGIIPAGSDNALCWTVLGVRDPLSAALAIVNGGLVPCDAFAVNFGSSDASLAPTSHIGACLTYYGFMSDVLGLSAKYQKNFGPLRYAVAGINRLANILSYDVDVEFTPADVTARLPVRTRSRSKSWWSRNKKTSSEEERLTPAGEQREAAPLISKRSSQLETLHESEEEQSGADSVQSAPDPSGREEGDHKSHDTAASTSGSKEATWQRRNGPFLSIMIANHGCRSVLNLATQCLAPLAVPNDGALDLILVKPVGRMDVLMFLTLMQVARHVELPFVEYIKVKEVRFSPKPESLKACGVDGELLPVTGPATVSVLPQAFRLLGQARAL